MPRPPTIWFREQEGWFYTTYQGKQTKLSKDEKEANKAFHLLHSVDPSENTSSYRPSFKKLADEYLTFTKRL